MGCERREMTIRKCGKFCVCVRTWFMWHLRWALNTSDFERVRGLSRWKNQTKQRWKSRLLLEEQLIIPFY